MSSNIQRLKERIKRAAALSGNIIYIPRGQRGFKCENPAHGKKETVLHSFTPRITEINCDCGTIYKLEGT